MIKRGMQYEERSQGIRHCMRSGNTYLAIGLRRRLHLPLLILAISIVMMGVVVREFDLAHGWIAGHGLGMDAKTIYALPRLRRLAPLSRMSVAIDIRVQRRGRAPAATRVLRLI